MSALGQKETFAVQKAMSAFPPKADIASAFMRLSQARDGRGSERVLSNKGRPAGADARAGVRASRWASSSAQRFD